MKKLMLFLVITLIGTFNGFATQPDTIDYSITAPSGLSLREAPFVDARRLDVIPYATHLQTIDQWDNFYNEDRIDTIGGKTGYWVKTEYDGKKGFIFSAYIRHGYLFTPSTEINRDFRILFPGERCGEINYDPTLNWYGLYKDEKTAVIKIKAIEIKINHIAYGEIEEEYYSDLMNITTSDENDYLLFFGTAEAFDTAHIPFEKDFFDNILIEHWDKQGRFIFPKENLKVYEGEHSSYFLRAEEQITINEDAGEFDPLYSKNYRLYLTDTPHDTIQTKGYINELSEAIGSKYMYEYDYSTYLGPRLFWQGDINNDGFPDMIFYTPYMAECCGGSIEYRLLISEWKDGKFILKKAAEDIVFSCYEGC